MKTRSLNKTLHFCVILVALVVLFLPTQGFAEQATLLWASTYGGLNAARDGASSMVMDGLGNVYVTGGVSSSSTGCDYATVKYDANGNELWVAYYNGSGNTNDFATSIAVDVSANIYVTGVSGKNIATVKYDSEGHQLWKATYVTLYGVIPGNLDFFLMHQTPSVAVDGSGNVYVAGTQMTLDGSDYVTIKYNASGTQVWLKTYDTPSNPAYDIDVATQVALDDSGNAYVTGFVAQNSPYDYGYATIKYNPAGTRLWVTIYGEVGPLLARDAYVPSMAVDASGNVYVTGPRLQQGEAFVMDYATIKYDTNGNQLWVAAYDGPGNSDDVPKAIALDTSGNVYVTGGSIGIGSAGDYATIKYDTNGNQLWLSRYEWPSWFVLGAFAVTTDLSGNVFVTGQTPQDFATVKYDTDGNELWAAHYDGPGNEEDGATAIAVDGLGNVYVAGYSTGVGTFEDYTAIKYDSSGGELWVARKDGTGQKVDSWAADMAVDTLGNSYVTGEIYWWPPKGGDRLSDIATVKYDQDGLQLWVARYEEGDQDVPVSLKVDHAGNVYVTGRSYNGTSSDYATVKYDPNGNELWDALYNSPYGYFDSASGMAVDTLGNVYVTGRSYNGTSSDYATVKYDPSGNELWVARYNGPGGGEDEPSSLGIDTSGNVYVTGRGAEDYLTVKYDSNGNELWTASYDGSSNEFDQATALAVDPSGNVYVTGYSSGSGTQTDYATVKYDSNGNELWAARYDGPDSLTEYAHARAVDTSGDVYVTGSSRVRTSTSEVPGNATVKYDSNGNELWAARYTDMVDQFNSASSLSLDSSGNVYVTGRSAYPQGDDVVTLKYDTNGNQVWLARYNEPISQAPSEAGRVIKVDNNGYVYVGGTSGNNDEPNSFLTIKYKQVETQPPWGTASIVGSAALNGETVQRSEALNHIAMLLLPIGTICLLRLFPRREKK
jgi:uncharacterized delta-60 repeat protein